ncbi:hypothetical protein WJX81_005588 [Elliptochloris bilobata]|uniref:Uncharacterized protein n=1 Tax=Elliptochloris bilobata TaxID=381761 RepID=A0AAW1SEE2_9CHLO
MPGTKSKGLNITGRWEKVKDQSELDCYSKQLDLLQIGGIQKATAVKLMNGINIEHSADGMRTEYKVDKVPFFKHCEEFRLGRETVMGRRDKKSGQQRAFLREVPEGLQIDIQLEQPFPGRIVETFSCPEDGILKIASVTAVDGREQHCIQMYRKAG